MKKRLLQICLFATYVALLLNLLDFDVRLIINVSMLIAVLGGSVLLTVLYRIKGNDIKSILERLRWSIMVTSYLTTFFSLVAYFRMIKANEDFYSPLIENFLPLFYALLIYVLIDLFIEPFMISIKKESVVSHNETNSPRLNIEHDSTLLEFLLSIDLTKREITIAEELISDLSNKQIADKLYITESTVKKHTQNIYRKASVKNRTEFLQLLRNR